jgi:hypothetical protein
VWNDVRPHSCLDGHVAPRIYSSVDKADELQTYQLRFKCSHHFYFEYRTLRLGIIGLRVNTGLDCIFIGIAITFGINVKGVQDSLSLSPTAKSKSNVNMIVDPDEGLERLPPRRNI